MVCSLPIEIKDEEEVEVGEEEEEEEKEWAALVANISSAHVTRMNQVSFRTVEVKVLNQMPAKHLLAGLESGLAKPLVSRPYAEVN